MDRKKEQIQERRESGKASLYRRGRADSVIRLGSNLFAGEAFSACVSSSHLPYFIGISELKRLCFYKKSSGYFYFFPASGYRNNSSGNLGDSGTWGYGWTSTPNGSSNAWNLNFNSGNANMNNNNRGNGFPVRCVQASAPVFVFIKNTFVFFPAAGVRRNSDGVLYYSGVEGDGWTSTPNDSELASRFILNSGNAYMGGGAARTYGFPVRCVQASAAVFAFIKEDIENTLFFFPAAGFRYHIDGSLRRSGFEGDGWSSTPYNNDGAYRFLLGAGLAGVFDANRTYGFPVRCVQASAPVFVFIKNTFVFFPAAGCRLSGGSLSNSGLWGFGWSSIPSEKDGRAWALEFSGGIACVYDDWRDYGFPVRCVQGSAAVFAFAKDTFIFFPASGVRHGSSGNLGDSGTWGYGWTSTPNSSSAWSLNFGSGNANMSNHNRGHGFPVRCVQGSAAVWAVRKKEIKQIRYRRESGKGILCRRGQADSVTRLMRKVFASENLFICAASSYLFALIKLPVFDCLYFYKHSSGYFLFFPASGYRNYNDGTLRASGTSGYGWSSTPGDGWAWRLSFEIGAAHVDYNYLGCAYGFPVRCVQASAAVFIFTKDTFVFFPASGLRGNGDGKLGWSGSWGGCWTSTLNGSGIAWLLAFSPASVYMGPDNGGLGLPVRCVQASAAVFVFIIKDFKETPVFFFPASGFRNYSDGGLLTSGTGGFGWTSTLFGGDVWYFECRSSDARLFAGPHGYGFPVRCVQASAAVFVFIKETFVFFPAAGHRNHGDGNLRASDMNGYAWSSTLSGGKAYNLTFNSGGANLHLNENRGHGFPVRCVQASAAVFAFTKDTFVFFPATGYRHYSNGGFYNSGTWGYWWTSTPGVDAKAWRLHVQPGACQMVADWCSYGFPVRCVQVSAAVWAVRKKDLKQIRYRRESGKGILCRRGQADSVTRLGRKLSVGHSFLLCAAPSYLLPLIKLLVFECLYFYKHSSGYSLFFPASGQRHDGNGSLDAVGVWGLVASSTLSGGRAWTLEFHAGGASVYTDFLSRGYSVRCVQASAAVWAVRKKDLKQIRYRRESGKGLLCRRGQADSVTRLGRKLSVGHSFLPCAALSYLFALIKLPVFDCLYFYKHSSGYFLFFPASGYRLNNDGDLRNSGTYGYGWTSTPDGSGGSYVYFFSGGTYVSHYDRDSGRSVRCVQASVAVFAFSNYLKWRKKAA